MVAASGWGPSPAGEPLRLGTPPAGDPSGWGPHTGVFCQAGSLRRGRGSLRGPLSVGLGSGRAPTLAPPDGQRRAVGSSATCVARGTQMASPGHQKKGPWTPSGGRACSLQSRTPRVFLQLRDWPDLRKLRGCCSRSAGWRERLTHPHTSRRARRSWRPSPAPACILRVSPRPRLPQERHRRPDVQMACQPLRL